MPRRIIKRFLPDYEEVRSNKYLKIFGTLLHIPRIWHLNRHSVSGAFACGLYWAMMPMPFQMVASAACAILFRVNLPLSVALVWLTNPLTMPPIYYFNYLVGTWVLGDSENAPEFQVSFEWMQEQFNQIWEPLVLGSIIVGILAGLIGYFGMQFFWRWMIGKRLRERKLRDANRSAETGNG